MTEFLQLCVAGVALGARYALVALGFVIIYRATGVINFAQGGLLLLGAYIGYSFNTILPFFIALACAVVATASVGATFERVVVRRMVGQPAYAVVMATIGLLFVLNEVPPVIWGTYDAKNLGDPFGIDTFTIGSVVIGEKDVFAIAMAALALAAFFLFFRYTKMGVAMRATALDQEAAIASGIPAGRVFMMSWAIAAGLAAIAGMAEASGAAQLAPGLGLVALFAFPAMILGGLDSPLGAIVGGIIIGLAETLTAGYQDDLFNWAGSNFKQVMPYLLMIIILLVRPYGLFGSKEVRRV